MRKYTILLPILVFAVLFLAACTAVTRTPADDGGGALAGADAKTLAVLGSLAYTGLVESAPVTLTNGVYTYTDASSGEQLHISLLAGFPVYGDLDGDDRTDAVAVLELDAPGSGRFTYLAPVLDVWNTPSTGPAVELDDRVEVKSITLADGQVVVDYIGHGSGDGDCCPSYNRRNTYAWQDGTMVEMSNEELGKADLSAGEQGSAAPVPDELSALSDEDFALFVAATQASGKTFTDRLEVCPEVIIPGGRQFPLAEPDYNAKRPLDLTAFAAALDGWTPEQAAAADELLAGKSIPDIQAADGWGAALRRRPGDVLRRSHQALRRRQAQLGDRAQPRGAHPGRRAGCRAGCGYRARAAARHSLCCSRTTSPPATSCTRPPAPTPSRTGRPTAMRSSCSSCAMPVPSSWARPISLSGQTTWIRACPAAFPP